MNVVAHNLLAINANRQFGIINKNRAKSTEKLSSGYKVNRAADDAAGLAISEKMRRQIRGLNQGSDNIQDGISLVQVAEGALSEITDMLQRINELSVKAYNDTNTREDREYIQSEINQLLSEINRTADTTTFNEIQILKWEPTTTKEIQISEAHMTTQTVYRYEWKGLPEWLEQGVDDQIAHHAENDGLYQLQEGEYMVTRKLDSSGNVVYQPGTDIPEYVVYGPDKEGALQYALDKYGLTLDENEYIGSWTSELADNSTAKINFKGLVDASNTLDDLYNNLLSLVGCNIGIPCGTCSHSEYNYGISFSGSIDGISATDYSYVNSEKVVTPTLNLTEWKPFEDAEGNKINCFEKIYEILNDETKTDAERNAAAKNLADEIARAMTAEVFNIMSKHMEYLDHFDRSLRNGDYEIVVYDYRDKEFLEHASSADSTIQKSCWAKMSYQEKHLQPGDTAFIEEDNPLWIQCSSQDIDKIPLRLPYFSSEALGISGYDVSRYALIEHYSDDYNKKMIEWEESAYEELITTTSQVPTYSSVTKLYPATIVDGEKVPGYSETKVVKGPPKTTTTTVTKKKYALDKPIPGANDLTVTDEYIPDDNRLIKNALNTVMGWRSTLGAEQNRMEHSYNNNRNKEENMTAAESRIRDTDMAKEMVFFSNVNILSQVGQAILAQANQSNQGILSLLS